MRTILYTQNESATIKNTIVVNGKIFHDFTGNEASDAFNFILKKSEGRGDWNWLVKLLIRKGLVKSTKFKYMKDASGILIRSNFKEKDDLGRHMPFLFYTEECHLSAVSKNLKDCATLINRTYREEELQSLDKAIKIAIGSSLSIGIILLSIIIWKMS